MKGGFDIESWRGKSLELLIPVGAEGLWAEPHHPFFMRDQLSITFQFHYISDPSPTVCGNKIRVLRA